MRALVVVESIYWAGPAPDAGGRAGPLCDDEIERACQWGTALGTRHLASRR